MKIHIVFWYNNKVLYFQTSDDRYGSIPATVTNYKRKSKQILVDLGLSKEKGDTVEYL